MKNIVRALSLASILLLVNFAFAAPSFGPGGTDPWPTGNLVIAAAQSASFGPGGTDPWPTGSKSGPRSINL